MNSGVLSLNTRRKVSFAAEVAGAPTVCEVDGITKVRAAVEETNAASAKSSVRLSETRVIRNAALRAIPLIACLDASHAERRFTPIPACRPGGTSSTRRLPGRNPKSYARLVCLNMAQRHRQGIRRLRRLWHLAQRQQRPHHQLNLPLIRMPITRDRCLPLARRRNAK